MIQIQSISEAITAKQAAELYGLKFDRRGMNAVCPWHNDHKPSLSFKGRKCRCFACNNGGDAVDITAQIFGITLQEAAQRLQADFGIGGTEINREHIMQLRAKQRAREQQKRADIRRYSKLCEIERNAGEALTKFDRETAWDDPKFNALLKAFAKAQDTLDGWDAR